MTTAMMLRRVLVARVLVARVLVALVLVALVLVATPAGISAQAPAPPLAAAAGQRVLVLPTQLLSFADSLGWAKQAPLRAAYLAAVDSALTDTLGARGLSATWTFAGQVVRSARRNAGFVADPSALAVESLRARSRPDLWQLGEPLATQLRSLIALTDARYVLLPVEMRTVGGAGAGRAQLKLVLIDARRSQVRWMGTVSSSSVPTFSPALAAGVASRVADLVVAR